MICGDFNTVLDNTLDIISGARHEVRCTEAFSKFVSNDYLIDTWRCLNGILKDFTWSKQHPFIARRLDYVLCSEDLASSLCTSKHLDTYISDHKAVIVEFRQSTFARGKSYWKLSVSLLHNIKYLDYINNLIDSFNEGNVI